MATRLRRGPCAGKTCGRLTGEALGIDFGAMPIIPLSRPGISAWNGRPSFAPYSDRRKIRGFGST